MTTNTDNESETEIETTTETGADPTRPTLDPITNRSEIIYLFDATDANPNGDPLTEENRPRVDEATDQALISDVRMKRIVRDYLDQRGHSIFVKSSGSDRDQRDDKGDRFERLKLRMAAWLDEAGLADGHELTLELTEKGEAHSSVNELLEDTDIDEADQEGDREGAWLATAADVRLFGDAMAFDAAKDADYLPGAYTGPIQFGWSRSLNKVRVAHDGKTSVLSAASEKQENAGGNMYTSHRIPYALFCTHGVINEHNATETRLSAEDVTLALDGLWTGVHELNTWSKAGHQPRLLLRIDYAEAESHIGDLHRDVSLKLKDSEMEQTALRDIEDALLDADRLLTTLKHHSGRIESISGRVHRRTRFRLDGDAAAPGEFIATVEEHLAEKVNVDISTV